MPEEKEPQSVPSVLGDAIKRQVLVVQDYAELSVQSLKNIFTPPR
jgi:hypothetical protein